MIMERDKFYFNDSYKFAHLDDIDGIVTDSEPDPATRQVLQNLEVQLF